MDDGPSMEENGTDPLHSESPPQFREYLSLPAAGPVSSSESAVSSSDSGSESLHMATGGLDHKSLCEREEERRSTSTMKGIVPAPEKVACPAFCSKDPAGSGLSCGNQDQGIPAAHKGCGSVFTEDGHISANEKEVEAEFLRLSLGLKCDWFTLEKRVKLEERSRDLAEENLKKEITNCIKLIELLTRLCEDDSQAQELLKKLENSVTLLGQCAARVASRAEMLGATNQESRVSKAVEVMVQHVENLKRMYAKEHAALEELKQALLQNERSFSPLEDDDDCQIKKRSSSLNSKPSSLRRVTIASLPRNLGNVGMASGMEDNDRFGRRSSSWRILGTKQSEHRPSLHRFISTYSWADAENEKCDQKAKDNSELLGEEVVERTRKPSLSEKSHDDSRWDAFAVAGALAAGVARHKAAWLWAVGSVLLAGLLSLLAGSFFHEAAEAAPTQDGDSRAALAHILWPVAGLQHNGPPPV
uniref:inositol 1,4,5-triphosphate receptor associated 2 n=1 Tax=Jaculus jaculus TaxID=51337 RepID=UPI001E1B4E82|nr:inositol 1,4,5-triphosphate receptor associated 2 [Jaculus jaculus]